jgi:hypothetical protein
MSEISPEFCDHPERHRLALNPGVSPLAQCLLCWAILDNPPPPPLASGHYVHPCPQHGRFSLDFDSMGNSRCRECGWTPDGTETVPESWRRSWLQGVRS